MTDNNRSEEIARLFKEASQVDSKAADDILHRLGISEDERRAAFKDVISGEHEKRIKAIHASEKLDQLLMRLRMIGNLLDTLSDSMELDPSTIGSAGGLIWEWVWEARKARDVLASRWKALEDRCDYRAMPVDGGAS